MRENSHRDSLVSGGWGVGRVVAGRYRLRSLLGAGAMGVVWRAADLRLDREVALKQLRVPPGLAPEATARARQRVFREGRVAARLQHPHAVAVYDVAADDSGQPMLVLEFLPSRSLATALTEHGVLSPARVARIGAPVASALAAAHAAGVVHRDVKPGNVLLAGDGGAKITDFGLSHIAGDVGDGLVAGTPVFLSPEAAMGERPSPASDVFSLGATLYMAVEGRPPFGKADNPIAQLERVAAGQAPPPRHAGPLTALLTSMLRDDPTGRPTMSQVAESLAEIAADHPVDDLALGDAPHNGAAIAAAADDVTLDRIVVNESGGHETAPGGPAFDESADDVTLDGLAVGRTDYGKTGYEGSAYPEADYPEADYDKADYDEVAYPESAYEEIAADETAFGETAVYGVVTDETAFDETTVHKAVPDDAAVDETAFGETAVHGAVTDGSAFDETTVHGAVTDETAFDETTVHGTVTDGNAVDDTIDGMAPHTRPVPVVDDELAPNRGDLDPVGHEPGTTRRLRHVVLAVAVLLAATLLVLLVTGAFTG